MSVTGYLALYTTLIGWQQYQKLWDLMVGTGIVFIPFIGIVLQCFLEPFESQEPKSAAVVTLRRLLIRVIGALLIIEFCCVPTIHLEPKVLHFEPMCVANPKIATPGNTGTTYDNQFKVPTGVKVPILWYLVMAISNGFTHAAIHSLSCSPIDYRTLQSQLNTQYIHDVRTKKLALQFYNQCYIPAYSKLLGNDLSESQQQQVNEIESRYGKDDVAWLGSHTFLTTPGFYNTLNAREPIPGFDFDANRDQFSGQVKRHSQWGQPNCKMWWSDPTQGLRKQLLQAIPKLFYSFVPDQFQTDAFNDIALRLVIKHSFDPGMNASEIAKGYESLNSQNGSSWFSAIAGDVGVAVHQLSYYPKLYLLINALPIVQALLLLVVYALLAIVIPFSSYRLSFMIVGSLIIFAITFWSYLWRLVHNIDNWLIGALYPPADNQFLPHWYQLAQGPGGGLTAALVHFIIGTLYVVLPILFFMMMTWAGIKISHIIALVGNSMSAPASQAGGEGVKTGIQLGKAAGKFIE